MYYAGASTIELNSKADSPDITEHSQDDKPRPYFCTVCDKRFTQKGHLNQHKQLHTGEKSYSCTQCEKRFTFQESLKRHMNVHSNNNNNNNNNTLIYIAPACRMTSEALADSSSRATECLTEK